MAALQPVRGTHDLLPDAARAHRAVEARALDVAQRFGFGEIVTPIFEFTEVFKRTLGDTSDIVTKEMYTFEDRGGESLTLRPEGTAAIVRAFISGGLAQQVPVKAFYRGPMFRYERPQKGRQRQFHQVGIEILGVEGPAADIEVITCGHHILEALGLGGTVTVELNTLGDVESRAAYRETLVAYLKGRQNELSKDSLNRLDKNPLRILDSKDEGDRAVVADAPVLADSLNDASRDFFARVQEGLSALGVPFEISPRLVRGLDYYTHTAFEFTTTKLGAQGTVLAGGRYDGLVKQMGGPPTPGVGWAAGVERLAMLLADPPPAPRPLAVVPAGAEAETLALTLTDRLRRAGFAVDLGYAGNMGKRMKRANKLNACAAVILGADEIAAGAATVRDLDSGEQTQVALDALEGALDRFR
ncbi:histidine--tRNA ligase [Roseospira navarrensis]|uniref:Histidine--tRNA ligase n=1 Tax=Roseospira navarrensis TaxID=140058 RepID=A0A7X2D486_9PROT|nr:histidine--tRNA ligase [Roseospira navarrensis]MQX37673.1 histidine--tRNA ligase [Roseospira navarrensis]